MKAFEKTFLYGMLIAGSIVFSVPFVWMIGTSFKVEREMAGSSNLSFVPETPRPALTSPFLDGREADPARLGAARASLPLIESLLGGDNAAVIAPAAALRLKRFLPDDVWSLPAEELRPRLEAALTPELRDEVTRNLTRRLLLGMVRVRSLDMHEADLTRDIPPHLLWKVVKGPGELRANPDDPRQAVLHYDFSTDDANEIVLEARVELPFPVERLHRSRIYLTPDDSWHNLFFELEYKGALHRGARPRDTGDRLGTVVTLQERSEDDRADSTKLRLWIPTDVKGQGIQYDHGDTGLVLRATLRRSSPLDAWWTKVSRNYVTVLQYVPFWRYVGTSVFLVILNIAGNVLSCSIAAYAFARLSWPGRNFSFGLMLATMMIPSQVTMIPFFLIVKHLGWYNSLTPLWVMSFFGNAFNIFLLRQFMMGIPRDLEDAAKIDGCNFIHIYINVILPLIKPTLACIAVFTFMGVWNDFMGPLIYLSDQRLYPLSLGLFALKVENGSMGLMMAGSLLMTLPVIIVFAFAQRYFIQGIALTGTKG